VYRLADRSANTKLANPLRRSPISFYAATTGDGDDFLVFEYRSVVTRTTSYVFDALLGAAWNCSMLTMRFQIPNPLWPWRVCQLNNNRPLSARAVNSWFGRALVRCAICDVCHCVARSCRLGTFRGTSHGTTHPPLNMITTPLTVNQPKTTKSWLSLVS
jgi:hypothetical protein